ncbi:MAG: tetratricopeptide repeat protein [Isosphaeraceae bacterium]
MAKKKRKRPERVLRRPGQSVSDQTTMPALPDRRAIEGAMRGFLGDLVGPPEDTPLYRAQSLMYEAFDSRDPRQQARLAREALEISPDCADAYVLLGELASSRQQALEFFEKGVAAGERALGSEFFRENVGDFWGILETRPYMRAREALASLLWETGQRDQAIAHLQEILRLNPNDNQGVRHTLCGWLLAQGRDEELNRLLNAYDEKSAAWAYATALAAFRREGDTPNSRALLEVARKSNKHVPAYLLGDKLFPAEQPSMYSHGSEEEAILHAASIASGWKETPGALMWLRGQRRSGGKRKSSAPQTVGPIPLVKERLARLPRQFDVWQADDRQFGHRIKERGEVFRPWLVIVISQTNDLVQAQDLLRDPPTTDLLWDQLANAIEKPIAGAKPHRPTELQVRRGSMWLELAPHLEELGIKVVAVEQVDHLNELLDMLQGQLEDHGPPGLMATEGLDTPLLQEFYKGAAGFYRSAPWRKLPQEATFRVFCDRFKGGPWYAVVMGQGGMTFGLSLYDNLQTLKTLWEGGMDAAEHAERVEAFTVLFVDQTEVPDADFDAVQKFNLELAAPEAYSWVFHKARGMNLRPPLLWEVQLLAGCLRAFPDFLAHRGHGDPREYQTRVSIGSESADLVLSWVEP